MATTFIYQRQSVAYSEAFEVYIQRTLSSASSSFFPTFPLLRKPPLSLDSITLEGNTCNVLVLSSIVRELKWQSPYFRVDLPGSKLLFIQGVNSEKSSLGDLKRRARWNIILKFLVNKVSASSSQKIFPTSCFCIGCKFLFELHHQKLPLCFVGEANEHWYMVKNC